MINKSSITIGIPAYNEANNIGRLLTSLLSQTISDKILEILVYSDASTDNTVNEASKIHDKRIKIVSQPQRLGKNATLNTIFKHAKGSVLVQFDADVLPVKTDLLEKLVKPIIDSQVDLVAADVIAMSPISLIEYFTTWGHEFRTKMYQNIHQGDTVYLCYGRARAFSQSLYSKLRLPSECPEDSYSYLFLKQINGKFKYARKAQVIFLSPASLTDYIHQSTSFVAGEKALLKYFSQDIISEAYKIPFALYFQAFWNCLKTNPARAITGGLGYMTLTIARKLLVQIPNEYTSKYTYLSTTKNTSRYNGKI